MKRSLDFEGLEDVASSSMCERYYKLSTYE